MNVHTFVILRVWQWFRCTWSAGTVATVGTKLLTVLEMSESPRLVAVLAVVILVGSGVSLRYRCVFSMFCSFFFEYNRLA